MVWAYRIAAPSGTTGWFIELPQEIISIRCYHGTTPSYGWTRGNLPNSLGPVNAGFPLEVIPVEPDASQ